MALLKANTGIGITNPSSALHVIGDGLFIGIVSATTFYGNLGGGVQGSVPYQSAVNTTTFLSPGTSGQVLVTAGSGQNPFWASASSLAGSFTGITIKDEGSIVGSAASISSLNFVGANIVATASGAGATITLSNDAQYLTGTAPGSVISQSFGLTVTGNVFISGNLSVGGTTAILNADTLQVKDKDIVLGITTNALNQDVSTDVTANHGGIAIASTEGSPLIDINGGVGTDSIPYTYKQIMWLKSGSWTGLGTDAWLFNYGVGIGSTQFPNGTRLAVGSVKFTENDLVSVRNINASGIITATQFVGSFSGNVTTADYATRAGIATYATSSGIATNVIGGIASVTSLSVSGISTLGTVQISSGIVTATTGIVTYYGDGSKLSNIISGVSISTNTTNQSQYLTYTTGTGSTTGFGVSLTGLVFNPSTNNLGIGTTNPQTKLQINGVLGFGTFTSIDNNLSTNIRIGDSTVGANLTSGNNNIFAGIRAGYANTSGSWNNFLGYYAGYSNTTGTSNNFIGWRAGWLNTTGDYNNFLGDGAGRYNTTGRYNNFFGFIAGESNTTGSNNNFFGHRAGQYNTTGGSNNFIGYRAGYANTTGRYNNFIGSQAGEFNTTGEYNNFFGETVGHYNTTGSWNIGIGQYTLENNSTGNSNIGLGYWAAGENITGEYNIFFGNRAGKSNITGSWNNFLGHYTGISTSASYKVIIGTGRWNPNYFFDSPDTTKNTQFAVGVRTDANPSKYWLVGNEKFNIGIGTTNPQTKLEVNGVLGFSTVSGYNILIGDKQTGLNLQSDPNTGYGVVNIFIGAGAGKLTTTGYYNNFLGHYAGYNHTTGAYNVFLGNSSGFKNTTGDSNAFVGYYAGGKNTTGVYNAFFGGGTGRENITGSYNTFLGNYIGISTSASNKVILGSSHYPYYFDSPDTTKDTQFAVGVRTDANPSKYWLVGNENFNVGIGVTNPTEKLSVTGNILINDTTIQGSFTATSATTSAVGIHSALSTSIYRSVEYTIQATQGTNFHATKILTIHNGTTAYNSEYGTIYNNASVSFFDVDVSGGNIRLLATPTSASTTNYTINFIATKI